MSCRLVEGREPGRVLSSQSKARIRGVRLLLAGSLLLGSLLGANCRAQTATKGREAFTDVALKLRAFPPDGKFFVDPDSGHVIGPRMDMRQDLVWGHRAATPGTAEYRALIKTNYPVPFLLSLLKDRDAKIRTLAAGALVARGEPRLQQELAPLVRDATPTFDVITTLPTDNYTPPQYTPQTVAEAVLRLLEMPSAETFDRYWKVHGGRDWCASWFLWQFVHPPLASVAKEGIARLRSPDRELVMLWIGRGNTNGFDNQLTGYSDEELLDAAKQVDHEDLLRVLRGDAPTGDPDMREVERDDSGWGTTDPLYWRAFRLGNFLLTHAKELLTEADATTLLEVGTGRRPRIPASREMWWVAAARLRPQDADSILDVAEFLWPGAGDVQLARWDVHGPAGLPDILEHFYRSPQSQKALACAIPDESYEPLVEAILGSKGRLTIGGEAMGCLAHLATRTWKEKAKLDPPVIDWIFAQAPDPDIGIMGPSRELVIRSSGVARKLVLDPRFDRADRQLLYVVEQCLVGDLKLDHAQSVRLDQLSRQLYSQHPQSVPEPILEETRKLLRLGVSHVS
jgi:hypothetical protein